MPIRSVFANSVTNEQQTMGCKNSDLIESDKSKWIEIINIDFMSSEESDCEDGELFIKVMPWRARKVNKFFQGSR